MKLSDKVKSVIAAVAPTLGTALGGPFGALAGNVLAATLGTDDPKAIEKAIASQSPEIMLKLREAEQAFTVKMRELDIEEDKIRVDDRKDARSLAKQDMRPHLWLTGLFLGGYFLLLYLFVTGSVEVPQEYRDTFLTLIGVITANVPTLMAFWFGSSHGSMRKNELIGK